MNARQVHKPHSYGKPRYSDRGQVGINQPKIGCVGCCLGVVSVPHRIKWGARLRPLSCFSCFVRLQNGPVGLRIARQSLLELHNSRFGLSPATMEGKQAVSFFARVDPGGFTRRLTLLYCRRTSREQFSSI